jgi:hypothetical protein
MVVDPKNRPERFIRNFDVMIDCRKRRFRNGQSETSTSTDDLPEASMAGNIDPIDG